MGKLFVFAFTFTIHSGVSQSFVEIKGRISDTKGVPLSDVHLVLEGSGIGTVSNGSGRFNLKIPDKFCTSKMVLSHVGYFPATLQASCSADNVFNIKMRERVVQLSEVSVATLSANGIMDKTIRNLEKNYQKDSVNYTIFGRRTDRSGKIPLLMEEFVFHLYHEENTKPEFNVLKIRARSFNQFGRKRLDEARLIDIHISAGHVMLWHLPDFLKRKKMKKYQYQLVDEYLVGEDTYYVISIDSDNYLKGGEMHIKKEGFGISYMSLDI